MKTKLLQLLSLFLFSSSLVYAGEKNKSTQKKDDSKTGYHISVKLNNFRDTVLYLGNYYGDKKYIKDTCKVRRGETFVFTGKEHLPEGIYIVVTPTMKYFEMMVGKNQDFGIETDTSDFVGHMKITNSMDNSLFLDYLKFSTKMGTEMDMLNRQFPGVRKMPTDSARVVKRMSEIDSLLRDYRVQFTKNHSEVLLASIFKAMPEPVVPDFPRLANGRRDSMSEFYYFRNHFFDAFDFNDERLLYTPIYHAKTEKYLEQLTVQHPDSLISSCDYLVTKAKANKEMYKWMVWYLTNKYENSKIMGFDAVFAHMGREYYCNGGAYWVDSAKLKKICDRVTIVENTIIGHPVVNMILQDSSANNHYFHQEMKHKYTIVWVWNSTCGHCQKETPELLEVYEKIHKKYDFDVITITEERMTNKDDPTMKSWRKYLKEHPNPWLNLRDMNNYYDFRTIFDAYATPKLFVIDSATHKIVAKQLGVNQLEDWFDKNSKMEAQKKK